MIYVKRDEKYDDMNNFSTSAVDFNLVNIQYISHFIITTFARFW